jgi:hypothetical protein
MQQPPPGGGYWQPTTTISSGHLSMVGLRPPDAPSTRRPARTTRFVRIELGLVAAHAVMLTILFKT